MINLTSLARRGWTLYFHLIFYLTLKIDSTTLLIYNMHYALYALHMNIARIELLDVIEKLSETSLNESIFRITHL